MLTQIPCTTEAALRWLSARLHKPCAKTPDIVSLFADFRALPHPAWPPTYRQTSSSDTALCRPCTQTRAAGPAPTPSLVSPCPLSPQTASNDLRCICCPSIDSRTAGVTHQCRIMARNNARQSKRCTRRSAGFEHDRGCSTWVVGQSKQSVQAPDCTNPRLLVFVKSC